MEEKIKSEQINNENQSDLKSSDSILEEQKELKSEKLNNENDDKLLINNTEKSNKINDSNITTTNNTLQPVKPEIKPKKELPIEKKPFDEFINLHLIPSIKDEFQQRGFLVDEINLKNTLRPIAGDKCWVVYCEIKDICNFWLSFEKQDISSTKSISLSKPNQKPSIIESFLIDEKRITLKLITSRILQRLNGQKLIGVN